ncbi:MAG: twin-arginine translocase subunit TatC [Solirubrobacterales bacterium]|nr:MAG: twin-arginine translocase subunit TatC [Solirubrobacterales bacterium]
MAVAVGRIGHEDRLSVVDHLDELRMRLIISVAAVAVAFAFCVWQNHALLHIINKPLATQTQKQVRAGHGPLGATYAVQQNARAAAADVQRVIAVLGRPGSGVSPAARASLLALAPDLQRAVSRLSAPAQGDKPVTLGIGEPFATTIGVSLLFALILALPVVLFELYGFVLPAFGPREQRAVRPLVFAIPVLFAIGVLFGYFVVLPAAVRFFQNFNSNQFNVLVQAGQYYHFATMTLLAMGLVFQVPIGILAITRAGIVTARQLRHNRRYAILACGGVAAVLPGDAITLVLETVPLYLLYEGSVALASLVERRQARRDARAEAEAEAV